MKEIFVLFYFFYNTNGATNEFGAEEKKKQHDLHWTQFEIFFITNCTYADSPNKINRP